MNDIIQTATNELGILEVPGAAGHAPEILNYAREAGFNWVNDDETPWCSIFMNWVAMKTNYERTKRANARSWLNIGIQVVNPEPGDIVIYWREREDSHKGHVGIFMGYSRDRTRIYTLGGNQGNSVSVSGYSATRLLGFRRLRKANRVAIPQKTLRKGNSGREVVKLQNALKLANFDCGTSDGQFGPMTEKAVKELQATDDKLNVSGIFNQDTRKFLDDLLNG